MRETRHFSIIMLAILIQKDGDDYEKAKIFNRYTATNVPMWILNVLWMLIQTLMLLKWILSRVEEIKENVFSHYSLEAVVL